MIRIFSDSTSDLSPELIERYHITIVPLHIVLGEKEYLDGIDITPDEIYQWSDEHKTTPKTSAVSMTDTIAAFQPVIEAGDEIIAFCISESMSTTGNVFRMAAEELEDDFPGASQRISVVNSESLSTGIGLLVLEAADMAAAEMKREDILKRLEQLKPLVRASFVVDSLTYLYRGGRCNAVAALAGGVLRLHPKIVVEKGAMDAGKKYRGKLPMVVSSYVKDMEPDLREAKKNRVFITHSGCDPKIIESVYTYLKSLDHFDEIHITRAGGVISSHCGYGTLGVLFIAAEN